MNELFITRLDEIFLLEDVILEGFSPVLFHGTTYDGAHNILKTDTFKLTSAMHSGSDHKLNKGKFFYLSLSRVKWGGYMRSANIWVNMEIDGRALSGKYKGISVDYWGPEYRGKALQGGDNSMFLRNNENEERLISNKQFVTDATKYIKGLHIYIDREPSEFLKDWVDKLRQIAIFAHRKLIPIYFYTDEDAYKLQDKSRSKKFTDIFRDVNVEAEPLSDFDRKYSVAYREYRADTGRDMLVFEFLRSLIAAKKLSDIPANLQKEARRALGYDAKAIISNDLSNARKHMSAPDVKKARIVIDILRTTKSKDLKDALDILSKKYNDLYKADELTKIMNPKLPTDKFANTRILYQLLNIWETQRHWKTHLNSEDKGPLKFPDTHLRILKSGKFLNDLLDEYRKHKDDTAYTNSILYWVTSKAEGEMFMKRDDPEDLFKELVDRFIRETEEPS